jgi:hypothetical protein
MDKDKYTVNVDDYNVLLQHANQAYNEIRGRFQSWKRYSEVKLEGVKGETERKAMETSINQRDRELTDLYALMDEGTKVIQAIIDQKSQHQTEAYNRGYQAAISAAQRQNTTVARLRQQPEKLRAIHEFNILQKWAKLY